MGNFAELLEGINFDEIYESNGLVRAKSITTKFRPPHRYRICLII